jgi:hypothetical protein
MLLAPVWFSTFMRNKLTLHELPITRHAISTSYNCEFTAFIKHFKAVGEELTWPRMSMLLMDVQVVDS